MFQIEFTFFYPIYEELGDCFSIIDSYVQKSLACIRNLKNEDFAGYLSKTFNVLSGYVFVRDNFLDHQQIRQQQLENTKDHLDSLNNENEIREHYDFLILR